MRKSALLTAVALLGGCAASLPPQREVEVAAAPASAEPPPLEARPAPAAPSAAAPRRPREIRIDNSSLDAFRASWERLRATLSPTQRADLNDTVVRLAFARYGGGTNLPLNLRNSPIVPELIRERIDGLTYTEILELAP